MSELALNNIVSNNNSNQDHKTCLYAGVEYIVMNEIGKGKDVKSFINVDGKRLYLDKNGNVAQKQPGNKNVKDCVDSYEDMSKIYNYLLNSKKWNIYLLFVLNYNISRRIGDILELQWKDFFDIEDGKWKMKKFLFLNEQKTGKSNEIKLNKAIRIAFDTFFKNETAFEQNTDTYNDYVFRQLHGTYKGRLLTQHGYRKALIKIEKELQLNKKLRSHGFRRGAFTNMIESHPNDPKAKTIVMDISKHSSEQMLSHYIGESAKNKEKYLDDLGNDFVKYAIKGEQVPFHKKSPKIMCDTSKLLSCMREAASYFMVKGIENANETDPIKMMEVMNEAMQKVEEMLEDIAE